MLRAPAPELREEAEAEAGADLPGDSEEFVFKGATHPDMVLSGLDVLRRENTFTDVRIKVEEAEFPVHKCVLSAFSPYFKVRHVLSEPKYNFNELGQEQDQVCLLDLCSLNSIMALKTSENHPKKHKHSLKVIFGSDYMCRINQ